ncbi:MAG: fimbrillin family protein, partial [Bacteroidales bacterium]|nr:fimbrillin family protein [Bacteroidales bacterium]
MKNIVKVWSSSVAFLLSAFSFLILVSCSQEEILPQETSALRFVVGDFPAFGESGLTRAIGTQDEGKTAWADDDKILVHLYSQKYGDQAVTLTFDAGSNTWESDDASLSYLENETPTITAVYAPDCEIKGDKTIGLLEGKKYGEAEYILARTTISGNILDISFESGRTYSRLRIVAEAEQTLTVTTTGFTPAGPENVSAPDSY